MMIVFNYYREKRLHRKKMIGTICTLFFLSVTIAQNVQETVVGQGWANNSVNAVIFRKNSLVNYKGKQFTAYYDKDGFLVLGTRHLEDTIWAVRKTSYKGNVADAHNSISIAIDGEGYLHVAWDHHNTPLRYARGREPFSLELGEELGMTGIEEDKVTYPEFYALPGGNLLFFYRSGGSGRGNMVVNTYDVSRKEWRLLHRNLIDGEGQRSAYWQAYVDSQGIIHLSWVWRETWDVASNHDLCYARSRDGGASWEKSTGEKYELPITKSTAEYAWKIPEGSGLINQTSMAADDRGVPYIATYWKQDGIPQYQVVYKERENWKRRITGFRQTPFELGGGGTKRIPLSRPQLLVTEEGGKVLLHMLFRDEERENKISLASTSVNDGNEWQVYDLTSSSVGQWEPSYDTELWKTGKQLHLFVQEVEQADGEGLTERPGTPVRVLEVPLEKYMDLTDKKTLIKQ
ncbi:BNR repeat-containing protein [Sinomicrobium sp. M5D2P17]